MIFAFPNVLHLIRAIIYGTVAVQAYILTYIYYIGYFRVKPTEIIRVLVYFFMHLAIFFSFLCFLAASSFFGSPWHDGLSFLGAFFAVPLVWFLTRFKDVSMDDGSSKKVISSK